VSAHRRFGRYDDGSVSITSTVPAATDPAKSIVVESDGSASYTSEDLSLVIESDGSGTYRDASRDIKVDSDRTGHFRDGEVDVSVTELGGFVYKDENGTIEATQDGEVTFEGDGAHVDVIAALSVPFRTWVGASRGRLLRLASMQTCFRLQRRHPRS
jgi:hypothetical protein